MIGVEKNERTNRKVKKKKSHKNHHLSSVYKHYGYQQAKSSGL
jgi:hypothetical protein